MEQRSEWVGPDGVDWVDLSRGPLGLGWRVSSSFHWVTGTLQADRVFFWRRRDALVTFENQADMVAKSVELNWYYKEQLPNKWRMWREAKNW